MTTRTILLAAALAAACTTQNNTALVITKVVPPTAATSTTGPTTCSFSTAADEWTFLTVNLAENIGNVAAVVENHIQNTANANPTLGGDASTFLPHQAVVAYEFPGNTNGAPPAGVTVKSPTVIPVSGLTVPGGGSATVGVPMFLPGVVTGAVPDGTFVRVTFHVEGKLLDGSTTRSSEREYLFRVCTTAGCAGNVCL
jgi:hypothetical protein